MKKYICILILIIGILSGLTGQVNGQLSNLGDRYLLHVWGDHYQRGYAQGYLLAQNIMDVFTYYFFPTVAGNSAVAYNTMLQYHQQHYQTDQRYLSEANGIYAGIQASGISPYHAGLNRDLGIADILMVNAIVDISYMKGGKDVELGCSSLSSWGAATQSDPILQGSLVITRLLDWSRNTTLIANPVLIVHHPSEADERKWISFTYPGLFGALSAITENNAAAFLNMGNNNSTSNTANLTAVLLDVRSGLERIDYNNDGLRNTEDLFQAVQDGNHLTGTIIHNVQQWQDSCRTAIIETNNSGTVRRLYNQNSNLNGDNLAATNHFRMLYDPVYCYRYSRIIDSLNVSPFITQERQWTLLKGAGGVSQNLMMVQYAPVSGTIKWAVATSSQPAYTQAAMEFALGDLFSYATEINDDYLTSPVPALQVFPNPVRIDRDIRFKATRQIARLAVYNVKGQLVYSSSNLPDDGFIPASQVFSSQASGIYFAVSHSIDGSISKTKLLYLR